MKDFLSYLFSIYDKEIFASVMAGYIMVIGVTALFSFATLDEQKKKGKEKSFSEGLKIFVRSISIITLVIFITGTIFFYVDYQSYRYKYLKEKTEKISRNLKYNDYDYLYAYIKGEYFYDNGTDDGEMTKLCEKNKYHQLLIKNAVPYYLKENKPDLAIYYLNTYEFQFKPGKPTRSWFHKAEERASYNQEVEFYNTQVFKIANYLKEHGKIKDAKDFLLENIKQYTDEDDNVTLKPIEVKFNYFMKD